MFSLRQVWLWSFFYSWLERSVGVTWAGDWFHLLPRRHQRVCKSVDRSPPPTATGSFVSPSACQPPTSHSWAQRHAVVHRVTNKKWCLPAVLLFFFLFCSPSSFFIIHWYVWQTMFSTVSMATAHRKRVSALDVINGDTQLFLKKCSAAGRVPDVIHWSEPLNVGTFFLHLSDVSIQVLLICTT